eukprot:CAMPEP_0172589296 /NCGR_PEP_ID=MMETSP1068-20121228/8070_1 /TAXON_ID=35684 /ORGANISM="Pseudopedinella elastica, Strain CCMP716" /LENGTH=457 /DNA_ID=CAMNT_0013384865 /DNA_START=38 /DNA_END=1411 /DNA_ORIENTATION=-
MKMRFLSVLFMQPVASFSPTRLARYRRCLTAVSAQKPKGGDNMARMGTGGLKALPAITPANELISRARKKAYYVKEDTKLKNARQRARKHAAMQLDTLTKELSVPLRTVVEGYRRQLGRLHPYEAVVAALTVRALERDGTATLEDCLAQVKATHKKVLEVGKASAAACNKAESAAEAMELAELGTEATVREMEQGLGPLAKMLSIQKALRAVPVIELEVPTVVLVGAPNVGKSSIIRAVSTGTPEVNDYPFTTRGVTIGHMFEGAASSSQGQGQGGGEKEGTGRRFQIMDTPGVLSRPDEERNEMESLTIASLQHLPTAVVFVADLTGLSGDDKSSVLDQCEVRRELRERFPRRPWLDVVSKADLRLVSDEEHARNLESFLEAVDSTAPPSTKGGTVEKRGEEGFRASRDDVLFVSSLSGEGLVELRLRLGQMLMRVDVVLRDYERAQLKARQQLEK